MKVSVNDFALQLDSYLELAQTEDIFIVDGEKILARLTRATEADGSNILEGMRQSASDAGFKSE